MAESPAEAEQPTKRPGKLRWILGWIVTPGALVMALFLTGVHVGARHPGMWLSRAILWAFDAEAQAGPPADQEPLARRLRLMMLPSKGYALEVNLSKDQLDAFVADGAGPSITELDCAEVCRAVWESQHADKEFIDALSCELTPPTPFPTKIDCEAKVQR